MQVKKILAILLFLLPLPALAATQFDGSTSYLRRTSFALVGSGSYSIGGWFYPKSTGAQSLFAVGQDTIGDRAIGVFIRNNGTTIIGQPACFINQLTTNNGATIAFTIPTNKWFYAQCVFTSGSTLVMTVYNADGTVWHTKSTVVADTVLLSPTNVYIGANNDATSFFNGSLRNVVFVESAISTNQIFQNMFSSNNTITGSGKIDFFAPLVDAFDVRELDDGILLKITGTLSTFPNPPTLYSY